MPVTPISTNVAPAPINIDLVEKQPPKSLNGLWRRKLLAVLQSAEREF